MKHLLSPALSSIPYAFSVVGTARCAVRAASSGATSAVVRSSCDIRSARCTRAGTSQRAVPTTLNPHLTPVGGVGVRLGAAILIGALALSTVRADSLWHDGQSRPLVGDKRAVGVGDILHILVEESNSTTKDNSTKTSKKASVDASINTFLYSPTASGLLTKGGQLPALKYSSASDFDGGGKINNSEHIVARIAVQVVDTLPNGNLIIEGKRQTAFSGETQDI